MPKISKKNKEKIQEQILELLFINSPKLLFTSQVASEIIRDEEFVKSLLLDLEKKELVIKVLKNSQGIKYQKRTRWRLSNKIYDFYKSSLEKKNHKVFINLDESD